MSKIVKQCQTLNRIHDIIEIFQLMVVGIISGRRSLEPSRKTVEAIFGRANSKVETHAFGGGGLQYCTQRLYDLRTVLQYEWSSLSADVTSKVVLFLNRAPCISIP